MEMNELMGKMNEEKEEILDENYRGYRIAEADFAEL